MKMLPKARCHPVRACPALRWGGGMHYTGLLIQALGPYRVASKLGIIFTFELRFLSQGHTEWHQDWAWATISILPLLITMLLIYPAEGG